MVPKLSQVPRKALYWLVGTGLLLGLVLFLSMGALFWSVYEHERIHDAARRGDMAELEAILSRNPDALERRNRLGLTPLLVAAKDGQARAVETLIHHGANLNAVCSLAYRDGNWNALHVTAINGRVEAAEVLIKNGVAINQKSLQGETPLDVAIQNHRSTQFIELLRSNGARRGVELP